MSLGSIYEDDDRAPGRDLRATVTIGRSRLGAPFLVEVPLVLEIDGEPARRTVGPGDSGTMVTLNLPADLPDGATLRMRGLGEMGESGRAGALYLTIRLEDDPAPTRPPGGWVVATLVLVFGVLAWALTR